MIAVYLLVFLCFGISVSAAINLSWGSKSSYARVRSYTNSYNDTWVNILDNGRSSWNSSADEVTFTTDNASNNRIYVQSYSDEWYGVTRALALESGKYLKKFEIEINFRMINIDTSNFKKFARGTVAHEI